MAFFKREETQQSITDIKNIDKNISKSNNVLTLFSEDTIEYIIKNFPDMASQIQNGLLDMSGILEDTIDHIEDKSSKLIKDNRNFKLSEKYRNTSISIYEVVENIRNYVEWMKEEAEKKEPIEFEEKKKNFSQKEIEKEIKAINTCDDEVNTVNIELEIYKDFSGKEPKGFEIGNNIVMVDDWDDLLVKTAEILTKQYKENKNSNIIVKSIKAVEKKSVQNEFRNTIIEMLNEYKINLKDFKIIVK